MIWLRNRSSGSRHFDSNGARLSEGNDALAAYGDMLQSSSNISGVVPQISLILGTCAGTAAMIACNADFVVMSEKAEFFLSAAGIDGTEGAGSAANAAKSGAAHLVPHRGGGQRQREI